MTSTKSLTKADLIPGTLYISGGRFLPAFGLQRTTANLNQEHVDFISYKQWKIKYTIMLKDSCLLYLHECILGHATANLYLLLFLHNKEIIGIYEHDLEYLTKVI